MYFTYILIFLLCLAVATALFIVTKKYIINKFDASQKIVRILLSIITFLIIFSSSIAFFSLSAVTVALKDEVDSYGDQIAEIIYETFPDHDIVQEGFDLSFILEHQETMIALAHMLASDDGMIDGLTAMMFEEDAHIERWIMDIVVRPIYPEIKNYLLEYMSRTYPDIYNMLLDFYENVFSVLVLQINTVGTILNTVEQYSGNYVITVDTAIEIIKAPVKSYVVGLWRPYQLTYQFIILLINLIYIGVLFLIAKLVENNRREMSILYEQSPDNSEQERVNRCANCGSELRANAKFCAKCGNAVDIVVEQSTDTATPNIGCVKCGSQLREGAKFCAKCGNAVDTVE